MISLVITCWEWITCGWSGSIGFHASQIEFMKYYHLSKHLRVVAVSDSFTLGLDHWFFWQLASLHIGNARNDGLPSFARN